MKELGRRLRQLREDRHLSQQELGAIFGKSQSAIGKYENERLQLDLEMLKKYSDFFGVSLNYILKGETGGNPAPKPQADGKIAISDLNLSQAALINLKRASKAAPTLNLLIENPSFLQLIIHADLFVRCDFGKLKGGIPLESIDAGENRELIQVLLAAINNDRTFEKKVIQSDLEQIKEIFSQILMEIRINYQKNNKN